MDQREWEDFLDVVKANDRPYAGYFAWRSDRAVEEIGVVQSFHESLEHCGEGFFHSFSARGPGNDPPDCEALSTAGDRIAIEVTELVDGESIAAAKINAPLNWTPFTKSALSRLLSERIAKKDNPSDVKGGPYKQYLLVIYCDDPRVLDYELIEHVRGSRFSSTRLLNRAFLLFSYSPWEKCCPYIELNLNGV